MKSERGDIDSDPEDRFVELAVIGAEGFDMTNRDRGAGDNFSSLDGMNGMGAGMSCFCVPEDDETDGNESSNNYRSEGEEFVDDGLGATVSLGVDGEATGLQAAHPGEHEKGGGHTHVFSHREDDGGGVRATIVDVSGDDPRRGDAAGLSANQIHTAKRAANISFLWMLLSLVAHTGWGIYPVLGRYLQVTMGIPSMSLLAAGNLTIAVLTGINVFRRRRFFYIVKGLSHTLPILILVTLCRTTTNLLAPRFVNAIFVQLVTLSVPFIVALFNRVLLHEQLPPRIIPAILGASLGGALMLFSSIFPFEIQVQGGDVVGIILAATSACFLAFYMILVRKATAVKEISVPGEELLFFLTGPVVLIGIIGMLVMGEDLSAWGTMDWSGWLAFIGFSLGVLLTANLLQITSIRQLGASTVSSTIAMRLVSTLIFSSVMMNEALKSFTQLIGAFVVLVTITAYMWMQRNYHRERELARAAEQAAEENSDSDDGLGAEMVPLDDEEEPPDQRRRALSDPGTQRTHTRSQSMG